MTIQQFKQTAIEKLTTSPSPALDADVLLQWILQKDKTFILFNRDLELTEEQEAKLAEAIANRKTGLPIAYITGHKEFFGLDFNVTPDVLIPKPDTEILVENSSNWIIDEYTRQPRIFNICDMCTGSGCVGISLMKFLSESDGTISKEHLPGFTMCDISSAALAVAKENADRLLSKAQRQKFNFVQTNLFDNLGHAKVGIYDIIVSNPPYVPASETTELLKDGRSEPRLALDGDVTLEGKPSGTDDGLALIRNLIPQAYRFLIPGGMLILETGEYNAEETERIMKENGFKNTKLYYDLEGQLRNVSGIK
ncbi:peptide chain release factor N(5)-glutamine methyltransferase [Treponema sp.]|uniref:peptide chain release factor N(5)-glutamine methyltransferase n=1 Tax=Treponema sp. TaxID=166 RepID=UPI00298EB3BB|nr:peptide chain release factor N(5)-glutamine methyltransferase [Treponema sp.]MCQ2240293.1 peptide chain release factor N(5)-glutamine methyltransferase [Treponema sp.]